MKSSLSYRTTQIFVLSVYGPLKLKNLIEFSSCEAHYDAEHPWENMLDKFFVFRYIKDWLQITANPISKDKVT